MSRLMLALLTATMLTGCASTGVTSSVTTIHGATYQLSIAEQEAVKASVTKSLRDPTSAIFDGLAAAKAADGTVTVCGFVNGKNGFGGYAGSQAFAGFLVNKVTGADAGKSGFVVSGIGDGDPSSGVALRACRQAGVHI